MRFFRSKSKLVRDSYSQGSALVFLMLLGGFALAGPSGLLAWSENRHLLNERQIQVKQLAEERDELRNRVALLDPRHTDPDLAGELLRRDLNVVHPDEMVMLLN